MSVCLCVFVLGRRRSPLMRSQLVHQISELLPADSCPHTTARSSTTAARRRAAGSCRPTFRGIIRGKPYVITAWLHLYNILFDIFRAYYRSRRDECNVCTHPHIHIRKHITTTAATGSGHSIYIYTHTPQHNYRYSIQLYDSILHYLCWSVPPRANIKYCNHNRNRVRVRPCHSGGYRYRKYLTFIIDSTGFFDARISAHCCCCRCSLSCFACFHNIHVNICISVCARATTTSGGEGDDHGTVARV